MISHWACRKESWEEERGTQRKVMVREGRKGRKPKFEHTDHHPVFLCWCLRTWLRLWLEYLLYQAQLFPTSGEIVVKLRTSRSPVLKISAQYFYIFLFPPCGTDHSTKITSWHFYLPPSVIQAEGGHAGGKLRGILLWTLGRKMLRLLLHQCTVRISTP